MKATGNPSTETPPRQEPPPKAITRPGAPSDVPEAPVFQPSAKPVSKSRRARVRHSFPPLRKRYNLRTQPPEQGETATLGKRGPALSPKKVVKMRVFDAPARTPRKNGRKSKSLTPTRWETPRKHDARNSPRRTSQPLFSKQTRIPPPRADYPIMTSNDTPDYEMANSSCAGHDTLVPTVQESGSPTDDGLTRYAPEAANAKAAVKSDSTAEVLSWADAEVSAILNAEPNMVASAWGFGPAFHGGELYEDSAAGIELSKNDDGFLGGIGSPPFSMGNTFMSPPIALSDALKLPDRTPTKRRSNEYIWQNDAFAINKDIALTRPFVSLADGRKGSDESGSDRRDSGTNSLFFETRDPVSSGSARTPSPPCETEEGGTGNGSPTPILDGTNFDISDRGLALVTKPTNTPAKSPKPQSHRRSFRLSQPRPQLSSPFIGATRTRPGRSSDAYPGVTKKTEAQKVTSITAYNTKMNAGNPALARTLNLKSIETKTEADERVLSDDASMSNGPLPVHADPKIEVWQASRLRWDNQLEYYEEHDNHAESSDFLSDDGLAGSPFADEIRVSIKDQDNSSSKKKKRKRKKKGSSAPMSTDTPVRPKRPRPDTPAKRLPARTSLLPADVQSGIQNDAAKPNQTKNLKTNKSKSPSAHTPRARPPRRRS